MKQDAIRTNLGFFTQLVPTESSISIVLFQPQQPQKTAAKTNLFLSDVYLFNLDWFNKLLVMSHLAA